MNNSEIIKAIRLRLGLNQTELASELGVSFATVNRWEKGHCLPSPIALKALEHLCEAKGIAYASFKDNQIIETNEKIILYHGSKGGLIGDIKPVSRNNCDFGSGFYMGNDPLQAMTLICNHEKAKFYTLEVALTGLKILDIEVGIDWTLLVAYHRGNMEGIKGSKIYDRIAHLADDCDMIIGYIADDRMFMVLDRFFKGEITDEALIHCLTALKLGKQYVALTNKACKQITILKTEASNASSRKKWRIKSESNRSKGIALADEIIRDYRRQGRYFDEILKAGE